MLLIILTLALDANIIIFDELINGLDPSNRVLVMDLLSQLKKDKLIIFSSHILHDVSEISDSIIFMSNQSTIFYEDITDIDIHELYSKHIHMQEVI